MLWLLGTNDYEGIKHLSAPSDGLAVATPVSVYSVCVTSVVGPGHSGRTGGQEPRIHAEWAQGAPDPRRVGAGSTGSTQSGRREPRIHAEWAQGAPDPRRVGAGSPGSTQSGRREPRIHAEWVRTGAPDPRRGMRTGARRSLASTNKHENSLPIKTAG